MQHGILAGIVTGIVTIGALTVSTAPANADPSVAYETESGAPLDPDSATTLTVSGTGFQSIKGGFGGIYVFFGWVDDGWRPSTGGVTGQDYKYVPDSEAKNNAGYQRFVSFPGSETEYAANGGVIADDGSWSTDLVVPGATFETRDRSGKVAEVDCREVTCGIITVGAHGVSNARNESFTPVEFASGGSGGDEETDDSATDDGAGATDDSDGQGNDGSPEGVPEPKRGKPVVSVDPATAVVGRIMSFTGYGFAPGEQIVVTLDDGIASVGPLTAGEQGEIAGVLELPPQVDAGTHTIRMTGAASKAKPMKQFAIKVDPSAAAPAPPPEESEAAPLWESTPFRFLIAAACVLVIVIAACVTRVVLVRRRTRRTSGIGAPATEAGGSR